MAKACRKTGSQGGVFIETYSGDGSGPVCTIGSRSDIRHIVKVTNLVLYPADITCKGQISSQYKLVRFSSPVPTDTADTWIGQKKNLVSGLVCQFNYVGLLSNIPGGGSEIVDLIVTIDWRLPQTQLITPLSVVIDA